MKSIDNETFVSRVPKRLGATQLSDNIDGVVVAKSARTIKQEVIDETLQKKNEKIIDFVIGDVVDAPSKKRGWFSKKVAKKTDEEGSLSSLKKRHAFSWGRLARGVGIAALVLGIIGVIGASVAAAVLLDYYNKAPSISDELLKPGESSIVYLADGKTELFRYGGNENREVVKLEQVPKQMQWAVIALEQKDFYKEDLPLKSLLRAITDCAGKAATTFSTDKCESGASGLAQQLYKNVTGDKKLDTSRKLRELFAAYKLLQNNSKDRILELYLNWVSYGSTINGVQVAAQQYFGKDIKDVTIAQACLIASMPQSPGSYNQGIYARTNPDAPNYKNWLRLEDRKNTCLDNLYNYDISGNGEKLIKSQEELDTLKKQDLAFIDVKKDRKYPHWQDYIKSELSKIFENEDDLNKGGLKIVTTIDPRIQDGLDAIMNEECPKINEKYLNASAGVDANAASVVLDGPTGNIVGMVGSCNYYDTTRAGQVNAVTSEKGLTPGSTFKPYDYVAALSKGFNPSTVLINKVTDFGGGYKPTNFGNFGAGGLVTFAYSLQNSLNIPALKSAILAAGEGTGDVAAGMAQVVKTSQAMGVKYGDNPDPASGDEHCRDNLTTAIGACPIQMLSHAAGFNTLAQDGNLRTPTPFVSISSPVKDRDLPVIEADNARYKAKLDEVYLKKDAAIDPLAARMLNSIITDNSLRNFGQTENGLIIPQWLGKIAGKTGTSTAGLKNRVQNVWTGGYTKKYTAVVWSGDMKGNTLQNDSSAIGGEAVAMPVWNRIMRFLHEGIDPADPINTFSTEGLVKGNALCPPSTFGSKRCASEWMSPDAQNKLNNYKALATKPDFDVFKSTIFEFRNESIAFIKTVNKIDGKMIKKDTFPAELVEEKNCGITPSAFPLNPAWRATGSGQDPACTEESPIDPSKLAIGISAIPSLASDSSISPQITVKGETQVPGVVFPKVEIRVDGVVVTSGENVVNFTANGSGIQGKKTVVIAATDQFGRSIEQTYSNVEFNFGPKMFAESDISAVNSVVCFPSNSFTRGVPGYSCSFAFPSDRKQPDGGIYMAIANSSGSPCNSNGSQTSMTCLLNIPLNAPTGQQFIKLRIGNGNYVNTQEQVAIN